MAKHLAPTPKHELNFIKKKPAHANGQWAAAPARHSKDAPTKRAARKPLKLPAFLTRLDAENTASTAGDRRALIFAGIAAVLLIALRFLPLAGWMVPAAFAVPLLFAAAEHVLRAFGEIRNRRYVNDSLLTCLAAVLLFATGLYTEAALLLILTTVVLYLETRFAEKSAREEARISAILPRSAALLSEEGEQRVDPAAVQPGDILLVRAGERIPLDGVVTEGITTIDTAAVSGQRSPWAVNAGYKVYAGCRNLTSDIKIRVLRPYDRSTGPKLVQIAEAAAGFDAEQEVRAAAFRRYYTPAAAGLALVLGLFVPIFRGGWVLWLRRAAVLLILGRTAADGFAIPLIYRKSLSLASALGVFVKGKDCLEAMARAETVIFDKTGAITEGRYAVTDAFPVKMSERQLLAIAAAAESFSRHPIAAAIRDAVGELDERMVRAVKIREIPGRGVSAFLGKRQVYVGNAALLEEHGIRYTVPARPGTAIHVAVDEHYCGYLLVTDKVRRRAFDALETLRVNGVKKLVLLTGDVMSVARPIASRLNFDMLRAELRPEEKAKAVGYLMKNKGQHSTIAFVGEGENSGRLLRGADVGIAMGSLGSDQALAAADVMIMDRDIFKVPKIFMLSRTAFRAAVENFALGTGGSALLALLGVFGALSPLAAVILSAVLSMLLLLNTLRIR